MAKAPSLDVLRKQIAALQAERVELESQTRSRGEVAAMVDGLIANWQAAGVQGIARELSRAARGEPAEPLTLRTAAPVAAAPGVAQISLNLGPILVAMLGPKQVKTALSEAIGTIPQGTDHAKRLERLGQIARELDALETEEEKLVFAGGFERRPNARPEIVLAVM